MPASLKTRVAWYRWSLAGPTNNKAHTLHLPQETGTDLSSVGRVFVPTCHPQQTCTASWLPVGPPGALVPQCGTTWMPQLFTSAAASVSPRAHAFPSRPNPVTTAASELEDLLRGVAEVLKNALQLPLAKVLKVLVARNRLHHARRPAHKDNVVVAGGRQVGLRAGGGGPRGEGRRGGTETGRWRGGEAWVGGWLQYCACASSKWREGGSASSSTSGQARPGQDEDEAQVLQTREAHAFVR